LIIAGRRIEPIATTVAGDDLADRPRCKAAVGQLVADAVGEEGADDEHQPYTHVEHSVHLVGFDVPQARKPAEDRRHAPAPALDQPATSLRHDPSQVLVQPAACDMGDSVNH